MIPAHLLNSLSQISRSLLNNLLFITIVFCCCLNSTHANALTPKTNFRFKPMASQQLEKIGVQRAMVQDNQGFIWFAGNNGLARFDAYDIKLYKHDDNDELSISHNNITDLLVDLNGNLWASTSHGLNKYNPETDGFIHYFHEENNPNSISHNSISSISESKPGHLALGTYGGGLNIMNIKAQTFTRFMNNHSSSNTIPDNQIMTLKTDHNGNIWLGTSSHGLIVYNPHTNTFTSFLNKQSVAMASTEWPEVLAILQDQQNNLWVGIATMGVFKIDLQTNSVENFNHQPNNNRSLADNIVWDFFEDKDNNLWVASDSALNLYHPNLNEFTRYSTLPGSTLDGKVRTMHQDKDNNLWFGLFPSGAAILDQDAMSFTNFQHEPHRTNSLTNSSITSVAEDQFGNLWIGTELGLNYLNRSNNQFTHYKHKPNDPTSLPSDAILSLLIDSHNILWVGTWRAGWAQFDVNTQKFSIANASNTPQHLSEEVWGMYEDREHTLWVAGLYKYSRQNNEFTPYQNLLTTPGQLSSTRVKDMLDDSHGIFWLATKGGLDTLNRKTGEVLSHLHEKSNPKSMSNNYVNCLLEDTNKTVWIGTRGGGINKYNHDTQTFTSYSTQEGLPDDSVTGIIEDKNKHLWLSTGHGISRFDPETETFRNFNTDHGLPSNIYNRKALLSTRQGEIVVGSTRGLTIFDPDSLNDNPHTPPIVFTKLQVFNENINLYSLNSPLKKPIHQAQIITLNHTQSVFSIEYSALNFRLPEQNQYAYKLEGFDVEWNKVGHLRRATYTNINPGTYIFHVKGSNNSGIWNDSGASIVIKILPPWWRTWLAYTIYGIIIFGAIYAIIYLRVKLKVATNDRIVKERLQQVDKIKDAFLANTSHELRTPLNGIIGLTQSLIDRANQLSFPQSVVDSLEVIVSSGKRLSNLINDILDFSKLRNHTIELTPIPLSIYPLITSVLFLSKQLVDKKPITFICEINPLFPLVYADEQRLQQILYNLIGNAIKFTNTGSVSIHSNVSEGFANIWIQDTGIGIKEDDFKKIFESFEQSSTHKGYSGTGLGLSVTKQLIELHGGRIDVTSTIGIGSTFTFTLPLANEQQIKQYEQENLPSRNMPIPLNVDGSVQDITNAEAETQASNKNHGYSEKSYTIMVVDDEPVNRMVIEKHLTNNGYIFVESSNGEEALQTLESNCDIDLILLDVMMPGKSGYEVCRIIREKYAIHQLPILFLTANNRTEDLQKGYQAEGNDFLFKPVLKEELLAKINVHLKLLTIFRQLSEKQSP